MHCIAERVKDSGNFISDVVRYWHNVVLRQTQVLCKGAGSIYSDTQCVSAQVSAACAAVAACAANDMAFTGHPLATVEFFYCSAGLNDIATEFMTDNHRRRDSPGGPLIPVPDVYICTANRRLFYLDQDLVRPGSRNVNLLHHQTGLRSGLYQCFHFTHLSLLHCASKSDRSSGLLLLLVD